MDFNGILEKIKSIDTTKVKEVASLRWVQIVGAFAAGALACTLLYPTKTITSKITKDYETKIQQIQEQHKIETTSLQTKVDSLTQTNKSLTEKYESKISELKTQITNISSHKVEVHYKLTKPDGTIEERSYLETEDQASQTMISEMKAEYDRQLQQTESTYQKKSEELVAQTRAQYDLQISTLKTELSKYTNSSTVTVNAKKLGLEVGYNTDFRTYLHGTYDIWGPVFIGAQIDKGIKSSGGGLGIGIRF